MDEISCYDYEEADIFPIQHKYLNLKVPRNELILCIILFNVKIGSGIAAGISSIVSEFLIYPLDTIKNRIIGISVNLVASIPTAICYTFSYEYLKQFYANCFDIDPISSYSVLLSSVSAQFLNCLIRNPFEIVKTQLQVGLSNSAVSCAMEIYRKNGLLCIIFIKNILDFYKGYSSLILRNAPYSACMFGCYEYLKEYFRSKNNGNLYNYQILISGAISASIAGIVTNPMDLIRCRIMTQKDDYYKSVFDCFRKVYYEEGPKTFTKALHIKALLCSWHAFSFFPIFEKIKESLLVKFENQYLPKSFSISKL